MQYLGRPKRPMCGDVPTHARGDVMYRDDHPTIARKVLPRTNSLTTGPAAIEVDTEFGDILVYNVNWDLYASQQLLKSILHTTTIDQHLVPRTLSPWFAKVVAQHRELQLTRLVASTGSTRGGSSAMIQWLENVLLRSSDFQLSPSFDWVLHGWSTPTHGGLFTRILTLDDCFYPTVAASDTLTHLTLRNCAMDMDGLLARLPNLEYLSVERPQRGHGLRWQCLSTDVNQSLSLRTLKIDDLRHHLDQTLITLDTVVRLLVMHGNLTHFESRSRGRACATESDNIAKCIRMLQHSQGLHGDRFVRDPDVGMVVPTLFDLSLTKVAQRMRPGARDIFDRVSGIPEIRDSLFGDSGFLGEPAGGDDWKGGCWRCHQPLLSKLAFRRPVGLRYIQQPGSRYSSHNVNAGLLYGMKVVSLCRECVPYEEST
jgi:hypothetical protein